MIILTVNLVGSRFAGAATSLVSQLLLVRLLTQADVGIVFLGMSAASFISLLITLGYPQLAVTCLPRYASLGRQNLLNAFHRAFLKDVIWVALATFAVCAVIYFWLPLGEGLKEAILFGCLSAPASASLRINGAIANSVRRYSLSYIPDNLYRPGLFLLFLLFCWGANINVNTIDVLFAFVIANTLVAIWQAYAIGQEGVLRRGLRWRNPRSLAPYLRGRAAALVLVGAVATLFSDIITLTTGFFLHAADVAVVGVCIKLAALAGFITQASQQFSIPDLSEAMTKGNKPKAREILLHINLINFAAMLSCILIAAVAGGTMLKIFGPDYERGRWLLVAFLVGQAIRAGGGMNLYLLSLRGFQVKTATSCAIAVLLLISLISALTPTWGITGVAFAVVAADLVWGMLLAWQAQSLTKQRGDILGLLSFHTLRTLPSLFYSRPAGEEKPSALSPPRQTLIIPVPGQAQLAPPITNLVTNTANHQLSYKIAVPALISEAPNLMYHLSETQKDALRVALLELDEARQLLDSAYIFTQTTLL